MAKNTLPVAASLLQHLSMRRLERITRRAESLSGEIHRLSDRQLKARFHELGAPKRKTMAHALALAREAADRSLGLRPYAEQLMAAAALFDEVVAEMKTGEGKTLAIGVAAAMAALGGQGVHVAVPNPYLAERDAEALRPFYDFLGLTVGVSVSGISQEAKQQAYAADITYAVHSELGFDYLRDHLVARPEQRVQRGLHFAIVDEADSILIDDARTPLVISQQAADDSAFVKLADQVTRALRVDVDVHVEEDKKLATLTESGMDRVGAWLESRGVVPSGQALYLPENLHLMRYIGAALRARFVYRRDQDYLVHNEQAHIIDSSTGRVLAGRRWQQGLHQAIEAKEGLEIQPEVETAAEITYQNFFGLYAQLAGLTGTAVPSAEEFETIYQRPVVEIPTHRPMIRRDEPDLLFPDRASKFHAIVDEVVEMLEANRPVLLGAGTVEESEAISAWLSWAGVPHRVLNARQHAEEAQIIADAGLPGAVTVATSMAGRGTDILLGGNDPDAPGYAARREQVLAAGGLHIIGTQRGDSRRVDDQLRGRAGRQGDPGSSRFFLSLEDDLLRVHGAKDLGRLAAIFGQSQGEGVHAGLIDKVVRRAQQRIESAHFGARHQMTQTDGALAQQRAVVYALRNAVLEGEVGRPYLEAILDATLRRQVAAYIDPLVPREQWEALTLKATLKAAYAVDLPLLRWVSIDAHSAHHIAELVVAAVIGRYRELRGDDATQGLTDREQLAMLTALDRAWREQLTELHAVREGIHLRSYAQQNPAHVFAREARQAFDSFERTFEDMTVGYLWRLLGTEGGVHASAEPAAATPPRPPRPARRLAPCPCGSGRRFKHCHGQLAA